jgi:hypothetical protein
MAGERHQIRSFVRTSQGDVPCSLSRVQEDQRPLRVSSGSQLPQRQPVPQDIRGSVHRQHPRSVQQLLGFFVVDVTFRCSANHPHFDAT